MYGRVFVHGFVANFLLNLTVKEFWKSVNIWWIYGQEFGVLFFLTHTVVQVALVWILVPVHIKLGLLDKFYYLGDMLSVDGDADAAVDDRIQLVGIS